MLCELSLNVLIFLERFKRTGYKLKLLVYPRMICVFVNEKP